MRIKRCKHCERELMITDFGIDLQKPDNHNDVCRECRRRQYRAAHGGTAYALRNFTDEEITDEILRRCKAYVVFDRFPVEYLQEYLLTKKKNNDETE